MNRGIVTIAGNTARDVMRQGFFCLITGGGIALLLCSLFFTLFAFGEESKMIQEMGLSTITICCLSLAALSATNTISREIEKGTIMMLLSKPVDKRSVILGKFFGILAVVSSVFLAMGILLTGFLWIRESLHPSAGLRSSFALTGHTTVVRLAFSFLSIAIMCAVATAFSVYLGMMSNLCCCMAIYILGNLTSFFHGLFPATAIWTRWYLAFAFVFFPNLEDFNTIGMGSRGESLNSFFATALLLYAILYITMVITLAIKFFNNKECR